jgi:hypothetical protein
MSGIPAMLAAAVTVEDVLKEWGGLSDTTRDVLIVLVALGVVSAGIWITVWFFGKPRRRHHRHRHHHGYQASPEPARDQVEAKDESEQSHRHRRKWRKKRRDHRPLNPTLAETGGLPPVRTGGPPEIKP